MEDNWNEWILSFVEKSFATWTHQENSVDGQSIRVKVYNQEHLQEVHSEGLQQGPNHWYHSRTGRADYLKHLPSSETEFLWNLWKENFYNITSFLSFKFIVGMNTYISSLLGDHGHLHPSMHPSVPYKSFFLSCEFNSWLFHKYWSRKSRNQKTKLSQWPSQVV